MSFPTNPHRGPAAFRRKPRSRRGVAFGDVKASLIEEVVVVAVHLILKEKKKEKMAFGECVYVRSDRL